MVSNIKNFLPVDLVGAAWMSGTLWHVENLLRFGWRPLCPSRPRKLASKGNFQEWPRKIHEIDQNIHKWSLNCQEAALNRRDSTALAQARVVDEATSTTTAQSQKLWRSCLALLALPSQARQSKQNGLCCHGAVQSCQFQNRIYCFGGVLGCW